MKRLSETDFLSLVDRAPLVAIDLIVRNAAGHVLLGRRTNSPAQGYLFVPGGRIRKEEPLDAAFRRITQAELGAPLERTVARLIGVYDHIYPGDNFASAPGITTHYVVLGHSLTLPEDYPLQRDDQHSLWVWMDVPALLAHEEVHANTKAYFR